MASTIPPVPLSHSSAWKELAGQERHRREKRPLVLVSGSTTQGLLLGALLWIKVRKTLDNKALRR